MHATASNHIASYSGRRPSAAQIIAGQHQNVSFPARQLKSRQFALHKRPNLLARKRRLRQLHAGHVVAAVSVQVIEKTQTTVAHIEPKVSSVGLATPHDAAEIGFGTDGENPAIATRIIMTLMAVAAGRERAHEQDDESATDASKKSRARRNLRAVSARTRKTRRESEPNKRSQPGAGATRQSARAALVRPPRAASAAPARLSAPRTPRHRLQPSTSSQHSCQTKSGKKKKKKVGGEKWKFQKLSMKPLFTDHQ
jgi:hypothetical protein